MANRILPDTSLTYDIENYGALLQHP